MAVDDQLAKHDYDTYDDFGTVEAIPLQITQAQQRVGRKPVRCFTKIEWRRRPRAGEGIREEAFPRISTQPLAKI